MATSKRRGAMPGDISIKGPACMLMIGYRRYLLPQADALKAMALLAGAVELECKYRDRASDIWYEPVGQAEVSVETVKPDQIRAPAAPDAPLALTHEPLKLTMAR